jgi:protein-tyrosine-phosphatase
MGKREGIFDGYRAVRLRSQRGTIPDGRRLAQPIMRSQKGTRLSAGTEPGERVHPEVVQVMKEGGIDLGEVTPQLLTTELTQKATLLVTMGCGDVCPYVPSLKKFDWPLANPKRPAHRISSQDPRRNSPARRGPRHRTTLALGARLSKQHPHLRGWLSAVISPSSF